MILLLANAYARMVSLESTVHARGKPMSVTRQYHLVMRQLGNLPASAKWLSIPSKQTVQVSNYYVTEPKCHFHLHVLDKDIDIRRFNLVIFIPPPNRTRTLFVNWFRASKFQEILCRGEAEGSYQIETRRSRESTNTRRTNSIWERVVHSLKFETWVKPVLDEQEIISKLRTQNKNKLQNEIKNIFIYLQQFLYATKGMEKPKRMLLRYFGKELGGPLIWVVTNQRALWMWWTAQYQE